MFNALVLLYKYVAFQDLGVAIILLTIIIRSILYPFFYHSFRNQTLMQKIQPEIQKIQHDHKDDKEKQAQALMALYKQNKVNPFSSFLLILVQLPVLIVLYRLFLAGLSPESFTNLYSFISAPSTIHNISLGLLDLKSRSILIVVFAALLQYLQARLGLPKKPANDDSPTAKMSRNMAFIGPVISIVILSNLPSAIGLYWMTSSAFSILQQLLVNKSIKRNERGIQKENSNATGNARP
jgi:YidC/Oxa1 family membrane protein insertase